MPDYQRLYLSLFNDVTNAIELLQRAQQTAEEEYIASAETPSTEEYLPEKQ